MSKINGQNYFNKGVNNNSKFHIYSKGYFFYNLKKPELNTIDYGNNTHMLEYNFKNDPLSNFRSETCDQSKKKLKNILKNQFLCNALPLMKINKKVVSNKSENSEIFERKCELINLDKVYIHKNEKNTLYTVKLKKKLQLVAQKLDLEKMGVSTSRNKDISLKPPKAFMDKSILTDDYFGMVSISKYSQMDGLNKITSRMDKIRNNDQITSNIPLKQIKLNQTTVLPIFTKMNNLVLNNYNYKTI